MVETTVDTRVPTGHQHQETAPAIGHDRGVRTVRLLKCIREDYFSKSMIIVN